MVVSELFPGFDLDTIEAAGITFRLRRGGNGPPVLLLHGHPQTHVMWHRVAPALAAHFTLIVPDLPGYGGSSAAPTRAGHEQASKRVLAAQLLALMQGLGHQRFAVVGHDRGGRVAYRMALDHPGSIAKLAVLDIVPTLDAWDRADRSWALEYWHWTFLAHEAPLPEGLIGANPDLFYFRERGVFVPEALDDYLVAVRRPEVIHALCEDYRAGASIDVDHDLADRTAGRLIVAPVLALWSARDLGRWHDVLGVWRRWVGDDARLRGRALETGHFIPEEAPREVIEELQAFLVGE